MNFSKSLVNVMSILRDLREIFCLSSECAGTGSVTTASGILGMPLLYQASEGLGLDTEAVINAFRPSVATPKVDSPPPESNEGVPDEYFGGGLGVTDPAALPALHPGGSGKPLRNGRPLGLGFACRRRTL